MLELLGTELKVKYVSLGFRSPPAQAICYHPFLAGTGSDLLGGDGGLKPDQAYSEEVPAGVTRSETGSWVQAN